MGFPGQFYVMDEADRIAYEAFESGLLRALKPVGEYEQQLAISISQDQWRLNRARGIEFNTFGIGHNTHADEIETDSAEVEVAVTTARTWLDHDRAVANLALYETRVHRMVTKNKRDLDAIQTTRKAEEAAAREIAELLLARAAAKGEKLETNQRLEINGFVFVASELAQNPARSGDSTSPSPPDPNPRGPADARSVFSFASMRYSGHHNYSCDIISVCVPP